MKKKIFILALTGLFFASSTAFPVVVHYCTLSAAMMKKMLVQDNCKINIESCQLNLSNSKEAAVNNAGSYRQTDCCSSKIVDNHLKDNYLRSMINNNFSFSKVVISCIIVESLQYNFYSSFNHADNLAPPTTDQNHLYLDNSVLLI